MLSPRLRQHILELWTRFWAGGLTNPITAIEQITYLLFLKQLESMDEERRTRFYTIYGRRQNCTLEHHPIYDVLAEKPPLPPGVLTITQEDNYCVGHNSSRWSIIKQTEVTYDLASQKEISPHEHLSKYVFPWLRHLHTILLETNALRVNGLAIQANGTIVNAPMEGATFQLPPDKLPLLQYAVTTIDELFKQVGRRSANYDLLGDIFEFMLDEIQTSGKNGQFRTPRHIIRFMIEMLDPKEGQRIIDPTAGTCGFLINSVLHLRKRHTPPEVLRIEWNGTPLRAYGGDLDVDRYVNGDFFTGYENDQTMARIGWMNMILHGIEEPNVFWRDSLSKSLGDEHSGAYDLAFANPPYTGNVDTTDLHEFPNRFPRGNKGPLTDKSELLFVWLILDLLKVGGKAAVVVPEGVLFGSTGAHRKLRQQLLMEHRLEAVISLPAGVFQPYTGVKTSIIVFQKVGEKGTSGDAPLSEEIWFYEITADGYSLDAKRNERPQENDLWDALEKLNLWRQSKPVEPTEYFRPDIFNERWRDIDEQTLRVFPELAGVYEKDTAWGIHELFRELPSDPQLATERIINSQTPLIIEIYRRFWRAAKLAATEAAVKKTDAQREEAARRVFSRYARGIDRLFREASESMFESLPEKTGFKNFARSALKVARDEIQRDFSERSELAVQNFREPNGHNFDLPSTDDETRATITALSDEAKLVVEAIIREFAKLDGYDLRLRSLGLNRVSDYLSESHSWSAKVRVWRRNDDWQSADGILQGSHDEAGMLRREYILDPSLYKDDGSVKAEFLESNCIEANDLNIAAGRYKPLVLRKGKIDPPHIIINELRELETKIQEGLARILTMVGE
jgi:type I restriction enzyme M protein